MKKRNASTQPSPRSLFISPNELAERWRTTRSTADRLVRSNGIGRVYLGSGRNGTIRYRLADVERFEQERAAA